MESRVEVVATAGSLKALEGLTVESNPSVHIDTATNEIEFILM
jgi:hypothetical protein